MSNMDLRKKKIIICKFWDFKSRAYVHYILHPSSRLLVYYPNVTHHNLNLNDNALHTNQSTT